MRLINYKKQASHYLSQFRPKRVKLLFQHFLADGLFSFIRSRG